MWKQYFETIFWIFNFGGLGPKVMKAYRPIQWRICIEAKEAVLAMGAPGLKKWMGPLVKNGVWGRTITVAWGLTRPKSGSRPILI